MVKNIIQTHHNICIILLSQQSLSKAKCTNSTSTSTQHSVVNQRFDTLDGEAIIGWMVVYCSPVRLCTVNFNVETLLVYMKCNI